MTERERAALGGLGAGILLSIGTYLIVASWVPEGVPTGTAALQTLFGCGAVLSAKICLDRAVAP